LIFHDLGGCPKGATFAAHIENVWETTNLATLDLVMIIVIFE